MIREQGPEDQTEIEAILTQQIDQAMFPLSSLRIHGLKSGDFASPHEHSLRIWRLGDSLVALTRAGMLMPYLDAAPDLSDLHRALAGRTLTGIISPATSARPVIAALGLDRLPANVDRDEPGFALDLARLVPPDTPDLTLIRPDRTHGSLLADWRASYLAEVMGTPADEARAKAAADIDSYLARNSHRLLLHHGSPVALTGFNAILPEIVQIGGVYTPPGLRGRGHARGAVALHLAEARASGATRAVLFAASDAAARAYRAIGFQRAQDFTLFLLATPVVIAG